MAAFRCVSMFQDPLPDVQCATSKTQRSVHEKKWRVNGHGPLEHPGSWLMHSSCLTTLGPSPRRKRVGTGSCNHHQLPRGFLKALNNLLSLKATDIHSGEFLAYLGTTSWFVIVDNSQKLHVWYICLHDWVILKFSVQMLINIPAPWYYGHPSRPNKIFIWTLKEALELRTGYLDDIRWHRIGSYPIGSMVLVYMLT